MEGLMEHGERAEAPVRRQAVTQAERHVEHGQRSRIIMNGRHERGHVGGVERSWHWQQLEQGERCDGRGNERRAGGPAPDGRQHHGRHDGNAKDDEDGEARWHACRADDWQVAEQGPRARYCEVVSDHADERSHRYQSEANGPEEPSAWYREPPDDAGRDDQADGRPRNRCHVFDEALRKVPEPGTRGLGCERMPGVWQEHGGEVYAWRAAAP